MDQNPFFNGMFPYGFFSPNMPLFTPSFPFSAPVPTPMLPMRTFAGSSNPLTTFAAPGFATPEMVEQMQKAMLESQKQQLQQLQKYLAEYSKSVDEALGKIEEEIAKAAKSQERKS